jgi:hypothetical protein
MTKLTLTLAVLTGSVLINAPLSADAAGFGWNVYSTNAYQARYPRSQSYYGAGYGYPNAYYPGGYGAYYHDNYHHDDFHYGDVWHDTSHLHYQPPRLIPHRGHFHYEPGRYEVHRTGHIDHYHD